MRLILLLLLLLIPSVAWGQPSCGPRDTVLDHLAREYGEVHIGQGVTSQGQLLEVLTSPSGSWTLLLSLPNGQSCIAAAGESWEDLKDVVRQPRGKGA
jgi:hypothetical protein